MKRLIMLTLIVLSINSASAKVINVDLDEMITIGLEQNQDIKIKRLELEAAEKDIKIANRLQNPQLQSNVVIGNVALGNCSQAGLAFPVEVLKRGIRKKLLQKHIILKKLN